MICPSCGHENPEGQRFCGDCGERLDAKPAPSAEVRKTVTIVFSDVTGSTALGERLDPEALRRVMTRYFDTMRAILERHGGTVEKFIGDAVMAVFGVPVVHEDDALRAARATAEMREALADLNKELERDYGVTISNRTGVNTGEVVAGTGEQTIATGDAVNTAARLEQGAAPGEILLGERTYRLVRDAVVAEDVAPLDAKGKADPVRAWRLVSVHPSAEGIARRRDAPIVGRERELRLLHEAFDRAIADRACVLFTILGAPGVGKSRLVEEFIADADAEVLRGRCLPYGDGITYWPIVEMLSRAAELSELDDSNEIKNKLGRLSGGDAETDLVVERLAQLLGVAGAPAGAEETFWAVRKLFESRARTRPLIVELDDIQWAEPTLVDLIEHVANWTRDAPVLLLCSARPDLLDARPAWGGGMRNAASIELEPLSSSETGHLVMELLAGVPNEVAERVAAAAEGIPLFVEHLVAMLVEDGTLERDGDAWTIAADVATFAVPPTVSALIEARLERLPPEELSILERASIEGKTFHRGAVLALSQEDEAASVPVKLLALVRRDLIRPGESLFVGHEGFAFRHLLIRDAAYARISKDVRADLHERYAAWLDAAAGEREGEFDEIVGYHLEQASRLRGEAASGDERSREAGARAAGKLGAAGRRAFDRGDLRAAAALLGRADALLPPSSTERVPILLDLGVVHEREGRYAEALAILGDAEGLARQAGDIGGASRAVVRRQFIRAHIEDTPQSELQTQVEALLPELEALGDDTAVAEACYFLGVSLNWLGQTTRSVEMLERAQEYATRSGDVRVAPEAASWIPAVMSFGPMAAATVDARWRELRASGSMSRYARAFGDVLQALSLAMMDQIDQARTQWREANAALAELGDETHAAASKMQGGYIELLAGEMEVAERVLTEGDRELERLGEGGYRSTVLCYLADAQQRLGRPEEAIATTERAEAITFGDDFETMSGWRSARARALADLGEYEDADRFAREALDVVAPTEAIETQARTWASLAYVLASAGRTEEALEAYREALGRYDRKGNRPSAERVRGTIARLQGEDAETEPVNVGAWGTTWPLVRRPGSQ
jgi:class 3 adenylate cyclase/tetratricopeptide (TPR) repeat protein